MKRMKFLLGLLIVFSLAVPVFSVSAKKFTMDTALQVDLRDVSDPVEVYQPFLDDLRLVTKLNVTFGGTNPDTFNDVADGNLIFGTGVTIQSGIPAMELYFSMPFGMEGQEFISWLFEGGGLELAREFYASRGVVPIPFRVTVAEGGGWFREPIPNNPEEFNDWGIYGFTMRLYGLGGRVLTKAFPAIVTPPPTPGESALDDFRSGHYTALEYSFPTLDKQQFFDKPNEQGKPNIAQIVEAEGGQVQYYIGSWFQPMTYHELWINKDFYDSLSQDVRDKIDVVSRALVLRSLAETNEGQGAAVKFFQDQGVTVWAAWPEDIRDRLRLATIVLINERSAIDPEWAAVVESMKAFVKNEQTRWAEANEERGDRFDWPGWESIIE
ncbi:MAG: hypothetical protein GTN76_08885 [Candidatus Aenigmarchaeota archaeon]|nr:hypothetical protein [Candidatus Aenigmarchaeota archaeon]